MQILHRRQLESSKHKAEVTHSIPVPSRWVLLHTEKDYLSEEAEEAAKKCCVHGDN